MKKEGVLSLSCDRGASSSGSQLGVALVGMKEGIVVIWPYAVVLTAAATLWSLSLEPWVEFMVRHVSLSPTESAAAALFAVFVAMGSSGYSVLSYKDEAAAGKQQQQPPQQQPPQQKRKQEAASPVAPASERAADATFLDRMYQYYSSESLNQQYALSLQYLKDTADYLQSQSPALAQQTDVILSQLQQIPYFSSSYLTPFQPAAGNTSPGAAKVGEPGTGAQQVVVAADGSRSSPAARRHQALHGAFLACCASGDTAAIRALFQPDQGIETSSSTTTTSGGGGGLNDGAPQGWQQILHKATESVQYTAWSMPLRKNLNVYKTQTVFHGATAQDFMRFMTDDSFRRVWDKNSSVWDVCGAPVADWRAGRWGERRESMRLTNLYCKMRIPPPFSARQYFLQRSVWSSASGDEGEIICSIRPAAEVAADAEGLYARYRGAHHNVSVQDYLSCCTARTVRGRQPGDPPRAEVTFMYFEDTRLPSALVNQIIKCRMETTLVKTEQAMREHMQLKEAVRASKPARCIGLGVQVGGGNKVGEDMSSEMSAGLDLGRAGAGGKRREKKKGLLRGVASVVTVGCLMPGVAAKWLMPVILSELTKSLGSN